jgi:hypothetical protein
LDDSFNPNSEEAQEKLWHTYKKLREDGEFKERLSLTNGKMKIVSRLFDGGGLSCYKS